MSDELRLPVPSAISNYANAALGEALTFADIATDFVIDDQGDADLAGRQLQAMARFRKDTDALRLTATRPYDALKKDIMSEFSPALEKAEAAERALRQVLTVWTNEQARIAEERRRAEQDRINAERRVAEQAAAKERARLETLKTPEARAKAEERLQAADAAVAEAEVSAPLVQTPARVAGFSLRDNWQAEYGDIMLLIKAAAVNPKLAMYLDFNWIQITSVVKAMKGNTDIPGVRVVNNQTSAVR